MIICKACGSHNAVSETFCAKCSAFLEWYGEREESGPVELSSGPESDPSQPSTPKPVVLTTISNGVQSVAPGSQIVFTLEIRNLGRTVDQLTTEVLGDAAAWAQVEPPSLNLLPGTSGTVTVRFRPPRSSAVLAGRVNFGDRRPIRRAPRWIRGRAGRHRDPALHRA